MRLLCAGAKCMVITVDRQHCCWSPGWKSPFWATIAYLQRDINYVLVVRVEVKLWKLPWYSHNVHCKTRKIPMNVYLVLLTSNQTSNIIFRTLSLLDLTTPPIYGTLCCTGHRMIALSFRGNVHDDIMKWKRSHITGVFEGTIPSQWPWMLISPLLIWRSCWTNSGIGGDLRRQCGIILC